MPTETTSASSTQDLHVWEAGGAASAEALTAWVSARLAAHESALAALLAVAGARTPENSLRHFDAAIEPGGGAGGDPELRGCGQSGARPGADGSAARRHGRQCA